MDITSACEALIAGSNPAGDTMFDTEKYEVLEVYCSICKKKYPEPYMGVLANKFSKLYPTIAH